MRPYESLRSQADFRWVRRRGRRLEGAYLSLLAVPVRSSRRPRLGIVAGKPVGGAVERNRARRRIRAVFDASALPGFDLIATARPAARTAPFDALRADVAGLLSRLERP